MGQTVCAEIKQLTKSYGKGKIKALDGVDLTIESGEIFGLIGPNGSGKTTLVGCLLGLLRPESGTVTINGKSPEYNSVHQQIGYMPERPDFEHWMTGKQFLEYHYGLARLHPADAVKTIAELLNFVELAPNVWERRLKTYSRGMLQRLNLAQGLLTKPKILLMDEPTLGLDPQGVAVVRKIVDRLREQGATAVINSHQLDEIERLCDRVAFIKHGKIKTIEDLKNADLSEYVILIRWNQNALDSSIAKRPEEKGWLEAVAQRTISDRSEGADRSTEHLPDAPAAGAPGDSVALADAVSTVDLANIAAASGATIKDRKGASARFVVKDSNVASHLIRGLVSAGILVEEAVPERARLEQLFLEQGNSDVV